MEVFSLTSSTLSSPWISIYLVSFSSGTRTISPLWEFPLFKYYNSLNFSPHYLHCDNRNFGFTLFNKFTNWRSKIQFGHIDHIIIHSIKNFQELVSSRNSSKFLMVFIETISSNCSYFIQFLLYSQIKIPKWALKCLWNSIKWKTFFQILIWPSALIVTICSVIGDATTIQFAIIKKFLCQYFSFL